MYSRRSEAVVPDWYTRKVTDIQDSDTKRRLWTWEKTQKPTEKKAYGIKIEVSGSRIFLPFKSICYVFYWYINGILPSPYPLMTNENVKTRSQRAKKKAKIFFDVCRLFLYILVLWLFFAFVWCE